MKQKEAKAVSIILEKIIVQDEELRYGNLPQAWRVPDIRGFSRDKTLFNYQQEALENIARVLYYNYCSKNLERRYFENNYVKKENEQLNRACFWMATGSGKTLVLIKTIEYIDYLMSIDLIDKREIMLLLPKEDLIVQFKNQIKEYNEGRSRKIIDIDLREYENDKFSTAINFGNEIKVYYYRSDLMRNERKDTTLDYKSYLNGGQWYLFLDEAHRGDSENSNLKLYVNELTKNGFLFNFSATFTDEIDITTTCYNFNLEKFITAGYGKNIYLSDQDYTFKDRKDEFTDAEKQMQVLKSFILFTLIKKRKKGNWYHNPLMLTLVNSVQAKKDYKTDSDLKMFCDYMLRIAQDDSLDLTGARNKLTEEFSEPKKYQFGTETLKIDRDMIEKITLEDIREYAFNSRTKSAISYYEGEAGKEIVFKLETSEHPFALIRIGDTGKFIKDYLTHYEKLSTFDTKNYMRGEINDEDSSINILLSSRAIHEGWDSNRPNIINMINIGKGEAKKFVPQSIGRGVRIQPDINKPRNRMRLEKSDENKDELLETLFIYPTDSQSINTILKSMQELGGKDKKIIKRTLYDDKVFEKSPKKFELLVPEYREKDDIKTTTLPFNIADESKEKFLALFAEMSAAAFILQTHKSYSNTWTLKEYNALKDFDKYRCDATKKYTNLNGLFSVLHQHINTKEKTLANFRPLRESEHNQPNDIIHYKNIAVELEEDSYEELIKKVETVRNFGKRTAQESITEATDASGNIDLQKAAQLQGKPIEKFIANGQTLHIRNIAKHYYIPILYSETEKIEYINHIIKHKSEKDFIEKLIMYIENKEFDFDWMFSKIDETLDNIFIPYLKDNGDYHNFFPDFIFWLKKDRNYKIVFIDPKGGTQAVSEKKIDGFKKMFDGQTLRTDIETELRMIGVWNGGEAYKRYWKSQNDFTWLTI